MGLGGAVLGEGDDGWDKEVGLLCGDPTSESVGRGALALPSEGSRRGLGLGGEESEGSRAGPLLSRRGLELGGGTEGRNECSFGQSSSGDVRRPAKGGGALGSRGISQGRSRGTNGGGSGRRASRAIEGRAGRVRSGEGQGARGGRAGCARGTQDREACRGVRSAQA